MTEKWDRSHGKMGSCHASFMRYIKTHGLNGDIWPMRMHAQSSIIITRVVFATPVSVWSIAGETEGISISQVTEKLIYILNSNGKDRKCAERWFEYFKGKDELPKGLDHAELPS